MGKNDWIGTVVLLGAVAVGGYIILKKLPGFLGQTISGIPGAVGGMYLSGVRSAEQSLGFRDAYNPQDPFKGTILKAWENKLPDWWLKKYGYGDLIGNGKTTRPDTPKGRGIRIPSRPPVPEWTKSKDVLHVISKSKLLQSRTTESLYGTKKVYTSSQGTSIITRSGR